MKDFNQLIVENMCKSFKELHVLNKFNLIVDRGEFVTFLGPSGCGKSTALNCISGLLNISGGKIQVDDQVLDDGDKTFVSPEKRGFGIIFQNYALFPHMSVFDNIAYSLSVAHKPKEEIRKRVEEAVRMVHLEGQESKYPAQLSGGQQQRVAIARSVVMEPRLLLLDEPLSNLDTKLRTEMRYELKQIHNRLERASIYVTHDQSEALALSDKIVIMKIGKIQQVGTPKQVYQHPVNRFVADFMGYKNIWEAKIEDETHNGFSIDQIEQVFKAVNSQALRLMVDLSAIAYSGETSQKWFDRFGELLIHYHFQDGDLSVPSAGHYAWGNGEFPLEQEIECLIRNNYSGVLTQEICGSADPRNDDIRNMQVLSGFFDE